MTNDQNLTIAQDNPKAESLSDPNRSARGARHQMRSTWFNKWRGSGQWRQSMRYSAKRNGRPRRAVCGALCIAADKAGAAVNATLPAIPLAKKTHAGDLQWSGPSCVCDGAVSVSSWLPAASADCDVATLGGHACS